MNLHLVVSYYVDKDPERARELDACLKVNLQTGHFTHITLFSEVSATDLQNRFEGVKSASELDIQFAPHRVTFREMFSKAASLSDAVHVFANSDIVFDHSIIAAAKTIQPKQCYALSRWDIHGNGTVTHFNRADSQDVWIVKDLPDLPAAFPAGRAGCDNKLAYLFKQAGYKVFNPSKDVRTYHMHLCGVRNYSPVKDRKEIRPPFLTVAPCRLNQCK